ncbi:hypothetical protein LTR09_006495 [Extremus antarcticus]|uniref:Isochorismatase-like domain-containing protein n=1 Tax=Extremus antarcticus TaxID=702011 RepID=A0AAJ0DKT1_9PEZI|nr:hypothetical protein LTR09_006495 [Extremus antarcticus]
MLATKSGISTPSTEDLLSIYVRFLAEHGQRYIEQTYLETDIDSPTFSMAAIFDPSNPASPLAYDASQTALLLMDFQGLTISRCGPPGQAALQTAAAMRKWALKHQIMVVHSVVDVNSTPPPICKGAERISKMLAEAAQDKSAAEEPTEIAFSQSNRGEYIVLKQPGFISALKSTGGMELLKEHGIRSLILCGLSTSGAVLRTAMPATDEGFVVSVIEDGCGDPNEGLHETLMRSVLPSRAHVATMEEFVGEWKRFGKE